MLKKGSKPITASKPRRKFDPFDVVASIKARDGGKETLIDS